MKLFNLFLFAATSLFAASPSYLNTGNIIHVDPVNGSNTTGTAGTSALPFLTLSGSAGAFAAAQAAAKPVTILLGSGTFTESSSITTGTGGVGITICGRGMNASVLAFTSTNQIVVSSSNIVFDNFGISRSGTSVSPVLTCAVTGTSSWLNGIRWNNLSVINASGTAIGTNSADTNGLYVYANVGCHFNYGGMNVDTTWEVPYVSGSAGTTYCVHYAEACAVGNQTGVPHPGGFINNLFYNFNRDGIVANNLSESGTGLNLATDFVVTGTADASYFPIKYSSCQIFCSSPVTSGTIGGVGLQGTINFEGGAIYGQHPFDHIHDSNLMPTSVIQPNGSTPVCSSMTRTVWQGASTVIATSGTLAFRSQGADCQINGLNFQTDSVPQIAGLQFQFQNCSDTVNETQSGTTVRKLIGWAATDPQCLRFPDGVSYSYAPSGSTLLITGTGTAECWFRNDATTVDNAGILYVNAGGNNFYGIYIVGSLGEPVAQFGTSTLVDPSGGRSDSAWHHAALTYSGTSGVFFVDGVAVASGTIPALSGTGTISIAKGVSSGSGVFKGDVTEARVSSIVRYSGTTTFTPPTHFFPDANTVALYGDSTREPLKWTNQVGNNVPDLIYTATALENLPFWVKRVHAYP